MLKALRHKKTAKKIWIALAIMIIISFVFWGFGRTQKGSHETIAGKIYGRAVSTREFQEALDATRNQAIIQFGDKFSEVQKYLDLNSQAWERLIALGEVNKRKIKVTDKEVEDYIIKLPYFQNNGQFDSRVYQEMLQYVFHTPARSFEEETRQNIALGRFFSLVTDDIKLNDSDIKQEYRKFNEEISVNYIAALPADFAKEISPNESDLKTYFNNNSFKFKQPISFNVEYLVLDSDKLVMEAAKLLNSKSDMEKVAKSLGTTVKTTGLFAQNEPISGIGWSPEILNIISNLKVGEYAQPMHLDTSYYILKLKERKEAYIPEFDKIKDKIVASYVKEESENIAKSKIEEASNTIRTEFANNIKSSDLTKIAKNLQLKSGITQPFKFGSYIEGIGASDAIWLAAENLKDDAVSQIINVASGLYIVKLKTRSSIDEKKFLNDKENFGKRLLLQKKQDYFNNYIDQLKKKAQPQ